MRTYKLFLIRHGLTEANFDGRYIGSTDLDLCEDGVAELVKLKDEYEYPFVDRVYVSPLKRCTETARLIYPDITPVAVPDLSEYHFGRFENHTAQELADDPDYHEWLSGKGEAGIAETEDNKAFQKRIMEGINAVLADMIAAKVSEASVVTHGGVITSLLAQCGLPRRKVTDWNVKSGRGYTLLFNLQLWQNSHLAEVFTPVPFGWDKEDVMSQYQSLPEN